MLITLWWIQRSQWAFYQDPNRFIPTGGFRSAKMLRIPLSLSVCLHPSCSVALLSILFGSRGISANRYFNRTTAIVFMFTCNIKHLIRSTHDWRSLFYLAAISGKKSRTPTKDMCEARLCWNPWRIICLSTIVFCLQVGKQGADITRYICECYCAHNLRLCVCRERTNLPAHGKAFHVSLRNDQTPPPQGR